MEDVQEGEELNERTLFLFGLSGVGKSFLTNYLSMNHGFYQYEADDDLTPAMKKAIRDKTHFTEEVRDEFFQIVANRVLELQKVHKRLAVSQAAYKNIHRKYLLERIPNLELVWVQASDKVLVERIRMRDGLGISEDYARIIRANFEDPDMEVLEILNEGDVERRLMGLVQKNKYLV